MASIINASSSGSGGIVQTADASGVLQLQSNGSVGLSISGTTVTGTTSVNNQFKNPNASGNYGWTTGSQGAIFYPNSSPGLAAQFIVDNSGRAISISTQDDNSSSTGSQLRLGLGASTGSTHATINVNDNTTGLVGNLIISAKSVTMPSQPMFIANGNQSTYVSVANNANVPLNTTKLNTSSSYNTSTYTFTAPVAGRYLFIMAFYMQGGSSGSLFDFWYNSTSYQRMYWQVPAGDHSYFGQCIVNMSAGDTMTIRNNTGSAKSVFIASDLHTAFSGYLIG